VGDSTSIKEAHRINQSLIQTILKCNQFYLLQAAWQITAMDSLSSVEVICLTTNHSVKLAKEAKLLKVQAQKNRKPCMKKQLK